MNADQRIDPGPGTAPGLSVVVPVYNSAPGLGLLIEELTRVLRGLGAPYEVILVNDGSEDESWTRIQALAGGDDAIRGFNLMRNFGQHPALLCGIRQARYSVIVTLDDDLQHPPDEIPKLLAAIDEGADMVYGVPERGQRGIGRNIATRLTKLALRVVVGERMALQASAFRAFRTELREAFADYRSSFLSIDVLLSWSTSKCRAVRVRHESRRDGVSNYTTRALVRHAFNILTGSSPLPLQLATMTGFVFTGFGLVVFGYVVVRYLLYGTAVPGFTFLASLIALFSGAQLFALGIVGEYLSRMHFRLMDRPIYAIRSRTERSAAATDDDLRQDRTDPR